MFNPPFKYYLSKTFINPAILIYHMLNKNEFKKIRHELERFEENREKVIQLSREIIKLSKRIIYGLHRDNVDLKLITKIKSLTKKLPKERYDTGMAGVALQEYVEALCFYEFVKNNKIPTSKQLGVDAHSYLLGICDLTGELVRKGVNSVIKKKPKQAEKIKEFVEDIYGEFLKFDLRNGELRKKSDQIKWNLNKLQDLIYDVKVKKRS